MAFCTKCGKQNPDVAKFCMGCGISISEVPNTYKENAGQATPQSLQNGILSKFIRREEKSAPITIILGIGLIIYSQSANFTKSRTYDMYDQDKRLGLPDSFNNHMLDVETTVDTEKKNLFLYGGLGLLAMGLYFNSRSNEKK